jgi:hypothetical protein
MRATGMENSEAKPLAQIESHSDSEVGWISRQNLLALRSRDRFFLDIPFYRTHLALFRGINEMVRRRLGFGSAVYIRRIIT